MVTYTKFHVPVRGILLFQAHMEAEGSRDNIRSRVRDHRLSLSSALTQPEISEAALNHAVPPSATSRKASWSVVNREGCGVSATLCRAWCT